jgi:hypothetical protein
MFASERACPHCGSSESPPATADETLQRAVQASIDEVERHGRRILEIAGIVEEDVLSPD